MANSFQKWDTPERIDEPELIDDESQPFADFRASMTDVQRANRFLGGTAVVADEVTRWLRTRRAACGDGNGAVTFLDVATGSGDLPA